MHQSAAGLQFHKTICSPPGRKIDPAGLDLAAERMRVAVLFSPAVLTRGKNVDHAIGDTRADIRASASKPRRLTKLRSALDALRSIKPRRK
jgi:hypothetical protein